MSSLSLKFTNFLSALTLYRVWLWFKKIFTKQTITSTVLIDTIEQQSLINHQFEHVTRFEDLSDELLLTICHYLRPIQILNAFFDCNSRMFRCISNYYTHINLTSYSYSDLQTIQNLIDHKRLKPSVLTLSNSMFSLQIHCLSRINSPLKLSCFKHVHRLSMLDCTNNNILSLDCILANFPRLNSLYIIKRASDNEKLYSNTCRNRLRNLIFDSTHNPYLTTIELIVNIDIILNKQIIPNERLTRLTFSLKTIDDLLVLLDGLVPNLIVLNVSLCDVRISTRLLLPSPSGWPRRSMSHLTQFRLTTMEKVEWKLEYLRSIVMVLHQLDTLSLFVKNWIGDDDNQFPSGNQIETIINEYLPHLHCFSCNIQTTCDINMETFLGLNHRWPMTYEIDSESSTRYLYTIPRQSNPYNTSWSDNNTIIKMYSLLLNLIPDTHHANLSECISNINTNLFQSRDFCRLRTLTTMNIEELSCLTQRIHTVKLIGKNDIVAFSNIYPNINHLVITNIKIDSLAIVINLVESFPNLRSLNIQFRMNNDYFDCLDVILNGQHLPHLTVFRSNWIDENWGSASSVDEWLFEKTIMKWRSISFHVYVTSYNEWTIWF